MFSCGYQANQSSGFNEVNAIAIHFLLPVPDELKSFAKLIGSSEMNAA